MERKESSRELADSLFTDMLDYIDDTAGRAIDTGVGADITNYWRKLSWRMTVRFINTTVMEA